MTDTLFGPPPAKRRGGRPKIVADPGGPILNKHDLAALCGLTPKAVEKWVSTGPQQPRFDPPIPPYTNPGACVWLRTTILPWARTHGFVPPGTA